MSLVNMLENALFLYAFSYMFELTVIGWCIIATYVAIFKWFELTTCFLTFYSNTYTSWLSQTQIFVYPAIIMIIY